MTKRVRTILVLALMQTFALRAAAELKTVAATPVLREGPRTNPLNAISIRLEVEPEQKLGASGLQLTVIYRNVGTEPVEILAPEQSVEVSFIDERQTVLETPPVLSEIYLTPRPGTQASAPTVLIPPGEEHRLALNVGDVIVSSRAEDRVPRKEHSTAPPPPPPPVTPLRIAAGKYEVRLIISIISIKRVEGGSRWVRSYLSDWFNVRLYQ